MLLLISRGMIIKDRLNLYCAFSSGLFLGLLSSINLGFYALIFLIIVEGVEVIRKSPLTSNFLTVIPISLGGLLLVSLMEKLFFSQAIDVSSLIVSSLLALPVYLFVRFWEERFVVRAPLKLRM